jgi:D-alanyl-lipoteichoic acid acyltransferase DltB (MBOAT superfamily)
MSFISLEFIIFFCIVTSVYFVLPMRWRLPLLLVSSYIFYAFSRVEYVLLIAFSTLVDYFAARELGKTPDEHISKRRVLLAASIAVNLGVLFIFKYFNFFSESLEILGGYFGFSYQPLTHQLILPVGISFYTFQSMAYTIDVYRKQVDVENDAAVFATYVAFFPQLVAGPIERAQNIIPQLREKYDFDYERVVSGLRLVLWGAFKKIVIADRLAAYVNVVYNDVHSYSGLPMILATLFFTFQIYCDFSGYSDIAIGTARILGFNLMENFRQPYFAKSVRDFWRRWHISLSTWFRDYLYIPLGGSRVSFIRNLVNLLIVFVVSGLWHGANWTFVIWGALHGGYIVIETLAIHLTGKREPGSIQLWIQRGVTFLLVVFAWIFFRANTAGDAFFVVQNIFDFSEGRTKLLQPLFGAVLDVRVEFLLSLGLIAFLMIVEWANTQWQLQKFSLRWIAVRWALYYAAAFFIIFTLLVNTTEQAFIYFQF